MNFSYAAEHILFAQMMMDRPTSFEKHSVLKRAGELSTPVYPLRYPTAVGNFTLAKTIVNTIPKTFWHGRRLRDESSGSPSLCIRQIPRRGVSNVAIITSCEDSS